MGKTNGNAHVLRERGRVFNLDILRFFCAFLVVCIHCPNKDEFWFWMEPLTRVAVPIFFMFSGYFFQKNIYEFRVQEQITKILKITFFWYVVYGIAEFCFKIRPVSVEGWTEYTKKNLFPEFAKLILANKPMLNLGGFLWYMFALIYVYIIFDLVYKKSKEELIIKIGCILLVLQYIVGMYAFVLGISTTIIRTRNFLLTGVPFFCLGIGMRRGWEKSRLRYKLNIWHVRVGLFLSLLFSFSEKYFLVKYIDIQIQSDVYLSTLLLAVILFVYALVQEDRGEMSPWKKQIAEMGKKYSMGVYLIHSFVLCGIDNLLYSIGVRGAHVVYIVFPLVVFLAALLCVMAYKNIRTVFEKECRG